MAGSSAARLVLWMVDLSEKSVVMTAAMSGRLDKKMVERLVAWLVVLSAVKMFYLVLKMAAMLVSMDDKKAGRSVEKKAVRQVDWKAFLRAC